ncbi:MAG: penicillin-binding protein 2 [Elusimicrobia bacterium]|nr:penicillin-binding protein 2 [Elusimicrobiota bacterium]
MAQLKVPKDRLAHIWALAYIGGAIIAMRLVDIQILRHDYYRNAAERNRTQVIYQTAPRGRVITADSVVVAASQPSFNLIYLPGGRNEPAYMKRLTDDFSSKLGVPPLELRKKLQAGFERGRPVKLAENLSSKTMFSLAEMKTIYPGVDIVSEAKRSYPQGPFASHLMGYMGRLSQRDKQMLLDEGKDYRMDSRVGKSGIEKVFERQLKGRDGGLFLEIDAQGRLQGVLQSEPWESGSDIHLTLDYKVQKAAEDGLRNSLTQKGAVVAINPLNGDLLALASLPDFDPNIFVTYSDSETDKEALRSVPEYNLATQGMYAPGSIFKIIVGAALLESGKMDPQEKVFCPGYYKAAGRVFKCWEKKGHGHVDFMEAMTHSCDVYFYTMGLRVGPAAIEKFERGFRLGMTSELLISGEKSGHVFGPQGRTKARSYWFQGDTLNLSIGQGELLVTPIQMAQMMSAVANKGNFWRPNYIEKIVGPEPFRKKTELLSTVNLNPETWHLLWSSLKSVVDEGTGQPAKIKGLEVYGKTGTAQNSQGDENAWFVAFAREPGKAPKIAVAVLVQHGLHGSSAAAPIARQVIEAAYGLSQPKPAPAEADAL